MAKDDEKNEKREIKRDGVVYTPSYGYDYKNAAPPKKEGQKKPKKPTVTKKRVPTKRPMTGVSAFFIIIVIVGAVMCVAAFSLFVSSLTADDNPKTPSASGLPAATKTPSPTATAPPDLSSVTAVIVSADAGDKKVELYDVINEKSYIFYADQQTRLTDKYGGRLFLAAFGAGDIVNAEFPNTGNVLYSLQMCPEAFTLKSISGVTVSADESLVSIGNEKYSYTYKLITDYKGSPFDISMAKAADILTLKGYKDKIWYAELVTGHADVRIKYVPAIIDCYLEIDANIYRAVTEDTVCTVTEGRHRAVVRGKNTELFIYDFTADNGDIIDIDVGSIKLTSSRLTINVTPPDALLTVNGVTVKANEPLNLTFDKYDIAVTKDGYEPNTQTYNFEMPDTAIHVELVKLPDPTPAPTQTPTERPVAVTTPKPVKVETKKMSFTTTPAGAEVFIDGAFAGVTPLTNIAVEYGARTVVLRLSGYTTLSFTYAVTETSESIINVPLQPEETLIDTNIPVTPIF
ncbi:hypothetical protein FACS189490_05020 [Clostridia bacterium]|nr:hypothetical protein FACS189490_05020 [Clostridia bacterium]